MAATQAALSGLSEVLTMWWEENWNKQVNGAPTISHLRNHTTQFLIRNWCLKSSHRCCLPLVLLQSSLNPKMFLDILKITSNIPTSKWFTDITIRFYSRPSRHRCRQVTSIWQSRWTVRQSERVWICCVYQIARSVSTSQHKSKRGKRC